MCLNFIAFSPIRLTIAQLRSVISTPEIIGLCLDDDNMVSEEDIAFMCGSLLRKTDDGVYFEFAHFSVREFLEHESLAGLPELKRYQISCERSDEMLALQSLRFLQLSNFDVVLPDPESLVRHTYDAHRLYGQGGLGFYRLAVRLSLQLSRSDQLDSTSASLMKSLFHPHKSSCFLLFASNLCFDLKGHCISQGLIISGGYESHIELAKKFMCDEFRPIHLAAALNLPDVCHHLIDFGSNLMADSLLGTPFELSVTSFLPLVLDDYDPTVIEKHHHPLHDPIRVLIGTNHQRNATVEIFEHAYFEQIALDSKSRSGDEPLVLPALIIAFADNNFWVLQKLLSRGMTLENAIYARLFPSLMSEACSDIKDNERPLLSFLQCIGSRLEVDSGWRLEIGRVIWNTAVELELLFTLDPTVTDSRISLSRDALVSRAFATIKSNDMDGLQECLADGRLDLCERHRDPLESHDEDDPRHLTLLHFAVLEDNFQATQVLAQAGCDPNIPSAQLHLRLPLVHDCSRIDIFEELLAHGASATDVEAYTGENMWHHYGRRKPNPETDFFESVAQRFPSETAKALLTKSKGGHTPLEALLISIPPFMSGEDHVNRAMGLIAICQGVADFWSRHDPIFGAAAAFGSEKVIRRLIEVGAGTEANGDGLETPLHRLGIESTSASVHCLNELFPGALDMRFDGQLPLQLYVERCSRHKHPIEDTVTQQLLSTESLESIDAAGTTLWEYYCHSSLTNGDDLSLSNDESGPSLVWAWLLKQNSAMQVYETTTRRSGLSPILSRLITLDAKQKSFSLISHQSLAEAIEASSFWEEAKAESSVLRFLHFAIRNEAYQVVNVLLDHGVSVSEVVDDNSSVQIACRPPLAISLCKTSEGKDILRRMMDLAELLHLKDYDTNGLTLLHRLATPHPDSRELHWLIQSLVAKGLDINRKERFGKGFTPLTYHISRSSISCAECLLELGADPRISDPNKPDAMMEASYRGFSPFMNKLLQVSKSEGSLIDWKRKVDIRLIPDNGQGIFLQKANAMHLICWGGSVGSVAFYVENGLIDDLDMASAIGWTAMHVASLRGNTRMIEYLSSKGCKIMPETDDKETPLHLAVKSGHQEAAKLLLRLGARDIPDATGMTPGMHASKGNDRAMVRLMRETLASEQRHPEQSGSDFLPQMTLKALTNAMEKAIQFNDLKQCQRLHAMGCTLNVSIKGLSPLVLALREGCLEIAEWLLDSGAETTAQMCGRTNDDACFNVIEICLRRTNLCTLLAKLVDQCMHDGSGWPLLDNRSFLSAIDYQNTEGLSILLRLLEERAVEIR